MDPTSFDLIETMAFDPHDGVSELERHLTRMKASAESLGFPFDRHGARNELQAATFRAGASVLRMRLSPSGALTIEVRPRRPMIEPVRIHLLPSPADHPLQAHSTSLARTRPNPAWYDCLFHDRDGFAVEGGFTSLFVLDGETLLTPPAHRLRRGGVLRDSLVETGRAKEADIRVADLPPVFLVGNMATGLVKARLTRR